MRILGYILLAVGFLSLLAPQLGLVQSAIDTADERFSRPPHKESYTRDEARDLALGAALSVARRAPSGIVPGLVMLVGAVLVDAARRKSLHSRVAEPGASPNVGPAAHLQDSGAGGGPPSVS